MAINHTPELANDLYQFLTNDNQQDVIIIAGNDSDATELMAHSQVLRARCSYFQKAFSNNWCEKTCNGCYIFRKPNISAGVFRIILRYLYTGFLDCSTHVEDLLLPCLIAADELGLIRLIQSIQQYLFDNPDILKDMAVSALGRIHQMDSLQELRERCLQLISKSPEILSSSDQFVALEEHVITMVLSRGDLQLKEIEVWNLFLKWVLAHYIICHQYSTLSSEELRKQIQHSLKEHISLIGFYDMSQKEFYSKVYPYKELLPQDLIDGVRSYHKVLYPINVIRPKRTRNFQNDSALFNRQGFELFARWIKKVDEGADLQNVHYNFILLLRASQDGFDASTSQSLCNDKGATLVVAKIKNSDILIGGYNPLYWSTSKSYLKTSDSFIFSLDLCKPSSSKVGRVIESQAEYAISTDYCFGKNDFVLFQNLTGKAMNSGVYEDIGLPESFNFEDFEVFNVMQNDKL